MEQEFVLPLGYKDEKGALHRKGRMRVATTGDELKIQQLERVESNHRLRDIALLSQVITRLGELEKVTPEQIADFFEADFLYLQLLYQNINSGESEVARVNCPSCSHRQNIPINQIYKDLHLLSIQEDSEKAPMEILGNGSEA
jgi:hypothetical protein